MKSWGIIIVTALGFLMGLILAGVGVTSAKTYFSEIQNRNQSGLSAALNTQEKKIDNYWSETDLTSQHLSDLISNTNCHSSEKYFLACVNSLLEVLPKYHMVLSAASGQLSVTHFASVYDGKAEKVNLQPFINMYQSQKNQLLNFDSLWETVLQAETSDDGRSYVIGTGINGFLSVYKDPHTYILPTKYFDEVANKLERSNLFVGVSFEKNKGAIFVRKVFKNSDAEASGLKQWDELLELNGTDSRFLNLADLSFQLKNPQTKVFSLKVKRASQVLELKINRSFRILNYVNAEKELGLRNYSVITLSKFAHGVCAEVTKQIKSLSDEAVAGMILDLRDNPGGELNEAACLAGLFIGMNKKIYSVKYFDPLKSDEVVLTSGSLLFTGPLVVLVNSSSASAAELLTGALQEYNRAIVVGEKTFGKGTFQEPETWSKNEKISLFRTQGFYLLPSGTSTQLTGVYPDFEESEQHVQMREETNFYNPIAATNYVKPTVANRKFTDELEKCKMNYEFKNHADRILKKGLEVLSCHRISSAMAGLYSKEESNQQ